MAQSKKSAKTVKPVKTAKKKVPPKIIKRPATTPARPQEIARAPMTQAEACAFAMSIAQDMKRQAAESERKLQEEDGSIRLTRRPKTRAQGKESVKFSAADLKDFKRKLQNARELALKGVDAMKATGFNESEDHEADGGDGTAQSLRMQALGQMGSINRVIQQIDEALHRIQDGTYGVCTSCGQLIRKPRLLNQPFVLTCMECQREVERGVK